MAPAVAPTTAAAATTAPAAAPTTASAAGQIVGTTSAADVKKYAGTTIRLAVQKHTATDAIQKLSPGFESQTGIKIAFEDIPQQQLSQKQVTDLSTGTGTYDVIGWFLNPEYVENNWIWSVDELRADKGSTDEKLLAMDDFFGKFLDYYKYKDQLWGLPFYGESLMMYYNADEFQKVGITRLRIRSRISKTRPRRSKLLGVWRESRSVAPRRTPTSIRSWCGSTATVASGWIRVQPARPGQAGNNRRR